MIEILPTDTLFTDSPDVGPECICSRCGKPILEGVPIRVFHTEVDAEYRYHPECLGWQPIIPDYDDGEDELLGL